MKKILTLLLVIQAAIFTTSQAQTQFITTGKIEYEVKTNMHKRMGDGVWEEQIKSKLPVYSTSYYDLRFDEHQSTYTLGRDAGEDPWKKMWNMGSGEDNVVYNNFDNGKTMTAKQVFEKLYLVEDSMMNIEWRITNDTRDIAGFECRKAVGRFYDTLYVVAFYTDQIMAPSGPGNYHGLPGMILGIAFPRFFTTIFATKLELSTPTAKELAPPTKGKKVSRQEMFSQVKDATKNWGDDWQKTFWNAVL